MQTTAVRASAVNERYVHALWCDDIRMELGDKPSFMGVYTAGIVLPELPAVLPRLGVHVWINTPIGQPFQSLNLQIVRDDGFILVDASPFPPEQMQLDDRALEPDVTRHTLMAGVMLSNIEVSEGCKYFSVCVRSETGMMEAQKLRVSVNPRLVDTTALS